MDACWNVQRFAKCQEECPFVIALSKTELDRIGGRHEVTVWQESKFNVIAAIDE
jgi:hypothetical protein